MVTHVHGAVGAGYATFQYPNLNRASTLWYHDHTFGMTHLNVYAGPAGFYIVRSGPNGDGAVLDSRSGKAAVLPGPAPQANDRSQSNKIYREIPIAIQNRAFNEDASLFYPDTRAFFDSIVAPLIPGGEFSPIWNSEFFGNSIMVNGNTWPFQVVDRQRFRFRFLNDCQSRFLILDFAQISGVEAWQFGNEGGFLAAPVNLTALNNNPLLMSLGERADVIVDFTNVPVGHYVLGNLGPDDPFGGGVPGVDFEAADPDSTGQVLEFRVVPATTVDMTTPPQFLVLPAMTPLPLETVTRQLSLIEMMGMGEDAVGNMVDGPVEALLGNVDGPPAWWWSSSALVVCDADVHRVGGVAFHRVIDLTTSDHCWHRCRCQRLSTKNNGGGRDSSGCRDLDYYGGFDQGVASFLTSGSQDTNTSTAVLTPRVGFPSRRPDRAHPSCHRRTAVV